MATFPRRQQAADGAGILTPSWAPGSPALCCGAPGTSGLCRGRGALAAREVKQPSRPLVPALPPPSSPGALARERSGFRSSQPANKTGSNWITLFAGR